VRDRQEPSTSTRREVVRAALVAASAALLLGALWLVSRGAPSATRDPGMTPPALVPTPSPQVVATPAATPAATPTSRARRTRRRR